MHVVDNRNLSTKIRPLYNGQKFPNGVRFMERFHCIINVYTCTNFSKFVIRCSRNYKTHLDLCCFESSLAIQPAISSGPGPDYTMQLVQQPKWLFAFK